MRNIIAISALCASLCAVVLGAEDYLNRSIQARDRIAQQLQELHAEVRAPSATSEGLGGPITHEYLLAQSIVVFERIVNYYDENQKKWVNDSVALDALKQSMLKEAEPVAKELMKIALAGVGERSFEAELVQIIRRKDHPTIRQFTISALCNSEAISAIPDLVTLLGDPYEIPAGCFRTDEAQTEFPIRRAAAFTLRHFGVEVKDIGQGRLQVDPKSLQEAMSRLKPLNAEPSVGAERPAPQP